jgi:zinc/manganese transport system substrate-binding protein
MLVVGAESQYANVLAQIGGRFVAARAVERNPNTDPHSYEANPGVAALLAKARLVVQNGLGYDAFMSRLEAAAPAPGRHVIVVQRLLRLPASTPNPHLWYSPRAMPAVARAIAGALAALEPAHAAYFRVRAERFDASLQPWRAALRALARRHPRASVAVTEPVGDYLLEAAGVRIMTPLQFQLDLMNGVDPAPQDVTLEQDLLASRRVAAFVYNRQVTDPLTQALLALARHSRVPVVAVYETMPPGYDYQGWMLAETRALELAVTDHISTERL